MNRSVIVFLIRGPGFRARSPNSEKGDAFDDFVSSIAEGPLFGERVGKSVLDFDPTAVKFDAIEKFDATIGKIFQFEIIEV